MATKQVRHCDIYPDKTRGVRTYRVRVEQLDGETWSDVGGPAVVDMSPDALHRLRGFIARGTLRPDVKAAQVKATVGDKIQVEEPKDIPGQTFVPGCEPEAK